MSILEIKYQHPTRPYSQNELSFLKERNLRRLRVGNCEAYHNRCKHFYYVRKGGRKEKTIKESTNSQDIGNCSICWKLSKTDINIQDKAEYLIDTYMEFMESSLASAENEKKLNHYDVELERTFYTWLYEDSI
uniref:Uncharacterized protein n=1 Tax=Iridovirus LCIVAC01 TaxID=2506607 RepID=A0A481YQ33_9VIRU|nr:MAG: hypothetical protein LCIVAC01_01720 [Iridovirus LCIVAC01]